MLDDDIRFIRLMERILRGEGFEVAPVTTLDLDEAVRVVASTGCFAALVDIFMYGDAAGFALIEKLRSWPATKDLPIVVASAAHREIGRNVEFLQKHRCTVLLKPFYVEDLITKVRPLYVPPRAAEREAQVVRPATLVGPHMGDDGQHPASQIPPAGGTTA